MISLSLGHFLTVVYQMWKKYCRDVKSLTWCLIGRNATSWFKKAGIVLGNKISVRGIEVDKAKIDVIEKLPPPMNIKVVRSFFGHAGFYRRFIKDFSKVAKPLSNMLNKDVAFVFNEECVEAFNDLKIILVSTPMLIALD